MNDTAERLLHHSEHLSTPVNCSQFPGLPAFEESPEVSTRHTCATVEVVPHEAIALRAYFRAKQRGFVPGHEREDWLAAEAELAGLWFAPKAAQLCDAPIVKSSGG
jgi:hypothetical protein